MQRIKQEPTVEKPKWALIAVSEAARKWRNRFELQPNKTHSVGRSRCNDIHLPSPFCSKLQCILQVFDTEIIMKDKSTHGTRVNRVNYKDSRCILSENDLLGFGCNTITKHNKDRNDQKYYVYRVALGSGFNVSETIELCDSSDEETNQSSSSLLNNSYQDGNETDDECPSADEMDVKPDIHSLMRMTYAKMQIKEEIIWNCYDYDKEQNNQRSSAEPNNVGESVELSDGEDDIATLEPPRKRIRQVEHFDHSTFEQNQIEPNDAQTEDKCFGSIQTNDQVPEYQMSETTRKEKVKIVVRSRGQQLATDMLMSKNQLMNNLNEPMTSIFTMKPNKTTTNIAIASQEASTSATSNLFNKNGKLEKEGRSIEDLTNDFISEVTKWDFQWICDQKPNPLRYKMEVKPLDTNFPDLSSFQRQMNNLLLMETYSILYFEYHRKTKSQNSFTALKYYEFDLDLNCYVYKCFAENKECRVPEICPADCVIVTHSKGKFLAYVTQAQKKSDGWEFELHASQVDKTKNQIASKFLQVAFITNIETMLECYISLYDLKNSSLQEVFLRPSSGLEDQTDSINDNKMSIASKVYERCAISIFGASKILLVSGGSGTGKTTLIYDLLKKFACDNFQFTNSILVCGMNNTLVDDLTSRVLSKIKNIARFGKLSNMKHSIREIGVEKFSEKLHKADIVFTTLNNAVDLLHAGISFEVCIVDDASLCSEAELLPLFRLKLNTLLLVGDEKLQTSTTQNECCRENGYSRSLFSRVIESYEQFDSRKKFYPTLHQQRRMHQSICSWPNKYFYNNKMKIASNARLRQCPFEPYTVFQVNTIEDIEIDFVEKLLDFCVKKRVPSKCNYGIICGHPDSKNEIEALLKSNKQFNGIEVSGYDSFQGREKDIIIMTALKPEDGFALFSTTENLLIALTRAKDSLILCCNFQHVITTINSMTSTWTALMHDANDRKRFFDLNGVFDEVQIDRALKIT